MKQQEISAMFASNLKQLRKNRGLNQTQYADLLHVTQKNLGAWEEKRGVPPLERLFYICKIEGLTVEQLVKNPVIDKRNVLAVE